MNSDYQIALTSVAFDNSYKNVLRFDNRSEQEAYFNVNTLFSNAVDVNFNVGSLYATNVVYDCLPTDSINELLNKNYCIVKDNTSTKTLNYYYYFVTNAVQDCGERIKMSLELDIFQTYYINLQFGECMINKAHLNRFIDNGDGTVSFDGSVDSKLFEREDIQNVAKRMTKRTIVNMYSTTTLGKWFNENVLGWLYIYCDPLQSMKFVDIAGGNDLIDGGKTQMNIRSKDGGVIPNQITVLVYPIYKSNKKIIFTNSTITTGQMVWGDNFIQVSPENSTLYRFSQINDGYSKVYAVKFSTLPPFTNVDIVTNYTISANGSLEIPVTLGLLGHSIINPFIDNPAGILSGVATYSAYKDLNGGHSMMSFIAYQSADYTPVAYEVNKRLTFAKSEIIGANKNIEYNPKLLSSDYFELLLSDNTENGFVYDLQKLNKKDLSILYTESITPDMTKKYIRFSNLNGVYIKETQDALVGFVGSNDATLLLPTSAYQGMIANNKNFFIQNSVNRDYSMRQATISTASSVLGGALGGSSIISTLLGGATKMLSAQQEMERNRINETLTVDNLKNSPSSIVGAKGNVVFENMYSGSGIVVEEYDILPNEKEIINDYMCLYGFTYNRMDNIKNVDNIRKYYNYVKANIETISGINISEQVHAKFRQCFAEGVRFWNTDTFSYQLENYENWLDIAQISVDYEGEDNLTITYNGEEQNRQFNASVNGVIELATTEGRTLDVYSSGMPYNPTQTFDVLIQRTSGQPHKAKVLYTNCSSVNITVTIT